MEHASVALSNENVAVLLLLAAVLPSSVVGLIGWFARTAFADIKASLANLTTLVTAVDKGTAILERDVRALEARVAALERERVHA